MKNLVEPKNSIGDLISDVYIDELLKGLNQQQSFPLCAINISVNQEHSFDIVLEQAINISKILNCMIDFQYLSKKVFVKSDSSIEIGIKNFEVNEITVITW